MSRRSTGGVVEKATSRGTNYGIRYRAGGRRVFQLVGNSADGVTRDDAQRELDFQLALVRRGEWQPPVEAEPVREIPTLHEAASRWLAAKELEGGRHGTGLSPSRRGGAALGAGGAPSARAGPQAARLDQRRGR
jgi:hypothetical protein